MGSLKLSLLKREYLSLAVIVLKRDLRFCIPLKVTFSSSITFTNINKYGKGAVAQTATAFVSVEHVACGRVL